MLGRETQSGFCIFGAFLAPPSSVGESILNWGNGKPATRGTLKISERRGHSTLSAERVACSTNEEHRAYVDGEASSGTQEMEVVPLRKTPSFNLFRKWRELVEWKIFSPIGFPVSRDSEPTSKVNDASRQSYIISESLSAPIPPPPKNNRLRRFARR